MNRLWVRLGLMIAGVLFLVFFLQFLAIVTEPDPPDLGTVPPHEQVPHSEIARRLIDFMILSLVVGLGGGLVIGHIVSAPIRDLAHAAHRIGQGDLNARVQAHGSQEMIELAETFNRMASDLQHADTLRANLMADVSHELRTPLTVLEGNLRAALDRVYALDETEIANLYGQTRHLIRLVNDLRELALAEAHQLKLEKQPTDVNALVTETLQALGPLAAEKNVRLTEHVDTLPVCVLDPLRIRQVLFNLLANALQHTPADGEIGVRGSVVNRELHLAVQDSGEGLEPAQLGVVFERFYRGDKSRRRETGGTGLGLAIVKAIVEIHDGRVQAQSEGKGRGSTFSIALPLK